jgi:hypothetical protein
MVVERKNSERFFLIITKKNEIFLSASKFLERKKEGVGWGVRG